MVRRRDVPTVGLAISLTSCGGGANTAALGTHALSGVWEITAATRGGEDDLARWLYTYEYPNDGELCSRDVTFRLALEGLGEGLAFAPFDYVCGTEDGVTVGAVGRVSLQAVEAGTYDLVAAHQFPGTTPENPEVTGRCTLADDALTCALDTDDLSLTFRPMTARGDEVAPVLRGVWDVIEYTLGPYDYTEYLNYSLTYDSSEWGRCTKIADGHLRATGLDTAVLYQSGTVDCETDAGDYTGNVGFLYLSFSDRERGEYTFRAGDRFRGTCAPEGRELTCSIPEYNFQIRFRRAAP